MNTSEQPTAQTPEVAAIREQLAKSKGQKYWQSLDELSGTPAFTEMLEAEFPRQAAGWN
ncbi:MAG: TAT-variant-translocated molybdopterin oxidoreductase, partial [Candidatus Sericytochromatia bacterium]|nr:TAT-variant-translocated molybdopterin oxidoreductase [Candidatus Sericytochromatia bacterium]